MFNSFQPAVDPTPYAALPAVVDSGATNNSAAWGSNKKFNYAREDSNDDIKFNEMIWRSVKGRDHPMPGPMRAGFVMGRSGNDVD